MVKILVSLLMRCTDMDIKILEGDCRVLIKGLANDSIDSIVTDPPYALVSIIKRFGSPNAAPAKGNEAYMRASTGFMGKTWDTGETAMSAEFWVECCRVLKPGGHVGAFGASRGYHRMACAIEDAGFEIRDSLMWVYGSGFPKSHNVSLSIDKAAGAVGHLAKLFNMKGSGDRADEFTENGRDFSIRHEPATSEAQEWEGWGTALKPAFEPIVLARKPLSEGTVATNVLRWRTGALNIGACRVGTTENLNGGCHSPNAKPRAMAPGGAARNVTADEFVQPEGRWPANVVHDGSDEVVGAFPSTKNGVAGKRNAANGDVMKTGLGATDEQWGGYGTAGASESAARFFYSAKASKADRAGSKHPTVKPIALMQWLARLITPPGGTVLDPFAGSGTTGAACALEGFNVILCEREAEYIADIKRRLNLPTAMPWESAPIDFPWL